MGGAWEFGFFKRPFLGELDQFMKSLRFTVFQSQCASSTITRAYDYEGDGCSAGMEFYYSADAGDTRKCFGPFGSKVESYGNLLIHSREPSILNLDDRIRIIKEKRITTELGYYQHLDTESFRWYEIALTLRDHYQALVISEQTGREIDPDRPFPDAR